MCSSDLVHGASFCFPCRRATSPLLVFVSRSIVALLIQASSVHRYGRRHPRSSSRRRPGSRRPRRPGLLRRAGERDAGAPQVAVSPPPILLLLASPLPLIPLVLPLTRSTNFRHHRRRWAPDAQVRSDPAASAPSRSPSSPPPLPKLLQAAAQVRPPPPLLLLRAGGRHPASSHDRASPACVDRAQAQRPLRPASSTDLGLGPW